MKKKSYFYAGFIAVGLILISTAGHPVHAADDAATCTFDFLAEGAQQTAEDNVRSAIEELLNDNDIDPDASKIDIEVTSRSEPYTAKDDDGKDFQGEHDYLNVKAIVTTKRKTVLQLSELRLFSAGPHLIVPKIDAAGERAPNSCAIDFSKKGTAPTTLTNTRTGHAIGKLEDVASFQDGTRSLVNVRQELPSSP